MSKFEVSKTVEAVKLNKRTGVPLGQPAISLPFGAIIDNVEESGDFYTFSYLAEPYRMRKDNVKGALHPLSGTAPTTTVSADPDKPEVPPQPTLAFEKLNSSVSISRAKVPGGWLVTYGTSITFVPDPDHSWDGASL